MSGDSDVHGNEPRSNEPYHAEASVRRGLGCLLLVVAVGAGCVWLFCGLVQVLEECDSCNAVMPYKIVGYVSGFTALAALIAALVLFAAIYGSHARASADRKNEAIGAIEE